MLFQQLGGAFTHLFEKLGHVARKNRAGTNIFWVKPSNGIVQRNHFDRLNKTPKDQLPADMRLLIDNQVVDFLTWLLEGLWYDLARLYRIVDLPKTSFKL